MDKAFYFMLITSCQIGEKLKGECNMQINRQVTKAEIKTMRDNADTLMKAQGLNPELVRYEQDMNYVMSNLHLISELSALNKQLIKQQEKEGQSNEQ